MSKPAPLQTSRVLVMRRRAEQRRRVYAVLDKLSDKHREAFILAEYEELRDTMPDDVPGLAKAAAGKGFFLGR